MSKRFCFNKKHIIFEKKLQNDREMIVRAEGVQEKIIGSRWLVTLQMTISENIWITRISDDKSESERGENDSVARDNYQPNC